MGLSAADRAAVTFALVGAGVGCVIGATTVWFTVRGRLECQVSDAQLARLAPPAPVPAAAPIAPPMPAPEAAVPTPPTTPAVATPAEPPPLTWTVEVTRVVRHGEHPEMPGFALRVDLAMQRQRDNPGTVELRGKTTCLVGDQTVVETVGFAPPPGTVLIGERGVGTFIDPFYWQRLAVAPSRCDFQFLVDGAIAGRACATIGDPITWVGEPCPVLLEAPLPVTPPAE